VDNRTWKERKESFMGTEGQIIVESEVDSSILEVAAPAEEVVVEAPGAEAGTETPPAEGTEAGEITAPEGQTVPKERMDEIINENAELKSRMDLMEQNNALVAANKPVSQPLTDFDIYKHAGVSENEDDSISVKEHRQTLDYVQKTHQAQIDDIRFHQQNPDFVDMVGTNEGTRQGQYAPPLAAAIKEHPELLEKIVNSANPKMAALVIARAAAGTVKATTDGEDVIDEAVRNAKRVKSGQTVRGGSGVGEQHRYLTETDAAFIARARKKGAKV